MKVLWAPWRMEFILKEKKEECIFCTAKESNDSVARLVCFKSNHSLVVMNKYPYINGHLLVAPNNHIGEFQDLDDKTTIDLFNNIGKSIQVLKKTLKCEGINVGLNLGSCAGAGITDHIHFHVIPRWVGDTNFMPILSETKIISEHIISTYNKLQKGFCDIQEVKK